MDRFELVGLADVAPGEEVHLAYTKVGRCSLTR
jgi:hypothetical protein